MTPPDPLSRIAVWLAFVAFFALASVAARVIRAGDAPLGAGAFVNAAPPFQPPREH